MQLITRYDGTNRRIVRPEEFESKFLEICESHRAQGRALAFAFLLFGARHPHVRRALEDAAYWKALDDLSGRTLTVFSFDLSGSSRRVAEPPAAAYAVREMSSVQWTRPDVVNRAFAAYFPGMGERDLPCVLFFQVEEAEIIDSLAVGLGKRSTRTDAAFDELNDILQRAVKALSQVEDESAINAREIFNLIRDEMSTRRLEAHGVRIFKGVRHAATVISLARALISIL